MRGNKLRSLQLQWSRSLTWRRTLGCGKGRMVSTAASGTGVGAQPGPQSGSNKKKVVVVGCGWAGAQVLRDLDPKKFDISLVSPRNHMIFTPLLPQTATGTLEFRSVLESIGVFPILLHSYNHSARSQRSLSVSGRSYPASCNLSSRGCHQSTPSRWLCRLQLHVYAWGP